MVKPKACRHQLGPSPSSVNASYTHLDLLTVLAIAFAILALISAYLAFRVYSEPEQNLNSITRTWRVLVIAVVLGSFSCIAGAVMAFGSAKSDIEAGWCVPFDLSRC